jgi:DNA-binding NarL/FixJ family response regulator
MKSTATKGSTVLTDVIAREQETQGYASIDRNDAIGAIKAALKARSGKSWSVTGGKPEPFDAWRSLLGLTVTVEDIRRAEAAYQAALVVAEQARNARNAAVARALSEGMTHAAIAEALGKSRGRVGQLAMEAKGSR